MQCGDSSVFAQFIHTEPPSPRLSLTTLHPLPTTLLSASLVLGSGVILARGRDAGTGGWGTRGVSFPDRGTFALACRNLFLRNKSS